MAKRRLVESKEPIPTNEREAAEFVSRIHECLQEIKRRSAAVETKVTELRGNLADNVLSLQEEIEALAACLQVYALGHRSELTNNGERQSVELGTGRIGWRLTPWRVEARGLDKILSWLKDHKLKQFIRTKEELNKEAMLEDPDKAESVPGISVVHDEIFFIKPDEYDTEIEVAKSRLKRKA